MVQIVNEHKALLWRRFDARRALDAERVKFGRDKDVKAAIRTTTMMANVLSMDSSGAVLSAGWRSAT
jgi:hypothetical protein